MTDRDALARAPRGVPVTAPDTAAVRARAERATPGPWRAVVEEYASVRTQYVVGPEHSVCETGALGDPESVTDTTIADAEFIAAMRSDVPALCDALDAARAEVERWHAECDKVGVPYDPPGLVRHHRANAEMAAGIWKQTVEISRARAEGAEAALAALRERIEGLAERADSLGHHWSGLAAHEFFGLASALRALAAAPSETEEGRCYCRHDYHDTDCPEGWPEEDRPAPTDLKED